MKRITYISRLSAPISAEEIEQIGLISSENNRKWNITGLLVYFKKLFFQIVEGEDDQIDRLFEKINQDPRHKDILCLKTEYNVKERLFPGWSMKTMNLDGMVDELIRPIRILLETVVESHTIIERYTQPTVLKTLNKGLNPLSVAPIPVDRIILFADIVSYSTIIEERGTSDMLLMINTYFEVCTRVILNHGGEVNKFLGDGVMAYFEAGRADGAIHACLEIMRELRQLRRDSPLGSPLKLLHAGFGLAQGPVIEGNMGSELKTDYTIVGDAVNTAARLESLTREVNHSLLLTQLVKDHAREPWSFKYLGNYNLKGKAKNHEVYSIDHELVRDFDARIPDI